MVLAFGAIAPLLLLRTPRSAAFGIRLWSRLESAVRAVDRFQESGVSPIGRRLRRGIGYLFFLTAVPVGAPIVRFATTIYALRHPLEVLRAIPVNFQRMVFAIDVSHLPQPVADLEISGRPRVYEFRRHLRRGCVKSRKRWRTGQQTWAVAYGSAWAGQMLLLYVPALFYRWALKGTSVFWATLIWFAILEPQGYERKALREPGAKPLTAGHRLELLLVGFERGRLIYSVCVLVFQVAIPLAAPVLVTHLLPTPESDEGKALLAFLVPKYGRPHVVVIRLWQFHTLRVINAAITIWLWQYAHRALLARRHGTIEPDAPLPPTVEWAICVRNVIGCVLMVKLCLLLWKAVDLELAW